MVSYSFKSDIFFVVFLLIQWMLGLCPSLSPAGDQNIESQSQSRIWDWSVCSLGLSLEISVLFLILRLWLFQHQSWSRYWDWKASLENLNLVSLLSCFYTNKCFRDCFANSLNQIAPPCIDKNKKIKFELFILFANKLCNIWICFVEKWMLF